ncbi:MAG: discoidin domain-containing protein [Candidatus Cryptobacteroides sp.]
MKKTINAIIICLLACGCTSKFTPESLVGEYWHTILNIKNSGEQEMSLSMKSETATFDLTVLKVGSEANSVSRATLKVMDYARMSETLQYGDYSILDADLFDFNPAIEFTAEEKGKIVRINIRQKKVLENLRNHPETEFILPLVLVSDRDSVNANKNCTFLRFVDGNVSKKISPASFIIVSCDLPTNGYLAGNTTDNIIDGDLTTAWRSIHWQAKAVQCAQSGSDQTAFWCNREDHDVTDYVFVEKFTNTDAGAWVDEYRVDLPWNIVIDLGDEYKLTSIAMTVPRIFDQGVDLSSYYQRIRDYEYWISTDNVGWELFASGSLPVYGPDTAALEGAEAALDLKSRYVKLTIRTLHWREDTEEQMKSIHSGQAYNEYHKAAFCTDADKVSKDPEYAQFKKCASVHLGPALIGEIEFWASED